MAKHRRTRKEKVAADYRTSSSQKPTPSAESSPSLFTINQTVTQTPVAHVTTRLESEHLIRDLVKTAILTSSIVIAELVLAFVIKL
jgi:hypothetical protein